MRFIFLFVVLLAIDLYAFQAFRVIAQGWSATARNILTVAYWLVPVFTLVLILVGTYTDFPNTNKTTFTILRTLVFIAYVSKFVVIPFLLIDDLRRAGSYVANRWLNVDPTFDASRSRFLSQFGLLLGGLPLVTLTYGMVRNPYRYQLFRQKVKIEALPGELEGLRIVQISDIHSGSFTFKDPVRDAIDLINGVNPDLVFFTGDLVNDRSDEMDAYMDVFDKIRARHGVFSVLGNHDYGDYAEWESPEAKRENLEKMKRIHGQLGWNLLMNENRKLDINGQEVAVIGVENYSTHPRFPTYGDLPQAHKGTEGAKLKLLLSHDPSHWQDQVTTMFQDIAITFSGHTHGFQFGVEIPGFLKWSPVQYIYKQWAGLYQEGKQYLYVNRGLGFIGYPGRVGILPEVTLLELTRA
jgi:hypothetical protein